MSTLDTWDWHYRVAFDQRLHQHVAGIIAALPFAKQRTILARQFEVFAHDLSVAQLVAHVCDEAGDPQPAIDLAGDRKPLFLPAFLGERYGARIRASSRLSARQKNDLLAIVERALGQRFQNRHRDIFEPVFGPALDGLLANAMDAILPAPPEKAIDRETLPGLTKQIVGRLREQTPGALKSLAAGIPEFKTTLVAGAGFAEYWPTTLSHADQNELIVYDNEDQLGYENFHATLAHEVLGHGTFYAFAEQAAPPFFDHGALAFIEGWATWCEWTASAPQFASHLRSARCRGLGRFGSTDPHAIQQQLEADTVLLGYSPAVAESSIEYFFQYPGFGLSYSLGALWFEQRLREQAPRQFLDSMRGQPWGDFFALW